MTLFAAADTWRLHLGWVAYTTALGLALVHIDESQDFSTAALGLFEGAVVEFRTLTAFVLGGFVLLVVNAWRDRRGGYSALASATTSLLLTIASTLPITEPDRSNGSGGAHGASPERVAVEAAVEPAVEADVSGVEERRHLGRWWVCSNEWR